MLIQADLLRAPVPAQFGGLGLEFDVIPLVAAELGRGCSATGWCYGVWAGDAYLVGMYPAQAQNEVWATGPNTVCASGLNPGCAKSLSAADGGYRLSGQWDFASGCDASAWALVAGFGPSGPVLCLVPRSDFEILDTWFVSGLRGTGSKDIVIDDAFVPAHRVVSIPDMQEARTPGRQVHPDSANYRIPLFSGASYVLAGPMVGMAQGTVDAFQSSMRGHVSAPRGGEAAQRVPVQMRLAEASADVWAARLTMERDLHDILDRARRDEAATTEERLRIRRNQAYIATLCLRAVNRLFEGSGGHALYEGDPAQRFHRDVHAAAHHSSLSWDTASEQYGRILLGLEPTNPRY